MRSIWSCQSQSQLLQTTPNSTRHVPSTPRRSKVKIIRPVSQNPIEEGSGCPAARGRITRGISPPEFAGSSNNLSNTCAPVSNVRGGRVRRDNLNPAPPRRPGIRFPGAVQCQLESGRMKGQRARTRFIWRRTTAPDSRAQRAGSSPVDLTSGPNFDLFDALSIARR